MSTPYEHVLDRVDDYLHDVLDPAKVTYVEQHCASCPVCKVALEEARKRLAALESVPPSEASEQLIQATLKKIDTHEQERPRRRRLWLRAVLLPAAAAALVLAV